MDRRCRTNRPDGRFAWRPTDDAAGPSTSGPTLDEAVRLVGIVADEARRIGCRETIVVVDALGDIVAQARMDGAWPEAGDIALTKASAACAFELATHHLAELDHPGLELFRGSAPEWRIFAGGVPLRRAGAVLGGLGVAGGDADQDRACARAAALAF